MFSRELYRAGRVCWVDWFGEARSITVKCGLGLLKTCFCSLFKSFAHYSNVLLTIQKFCSLLDTFAHYWSLLLTIGHFWKRPAGSKTVITVRYYGNANQEKCTKNGALTDTALSKRHKKTARSPTLLLCRNGTKKGKNDDGRWWGQPVCHNLVTLMT
jgi:hypothetical protein